MIKFIFSSFVFFVSIYFIEQNDPVASFVNYYSNTQNIYAEFETLLPVQSNAKIKGTIFFTIDGKTKLNFNGNVILFDNEVIKSYNKRLNRLIISSADEYDVPVDFKNLFNSILTTDNVKLINAMQDGYSFNVPEVSFSNAKSAKVYTDSNFNIKQIDIEFTNGSSNLIIFSKFIKNYKFGEDAFKLDIPDNCKIVDIR